MKYKINYKEINMSQIQCDIPIVIGDVIRTNGEGYVTVTDREFEQRKVKGGHGEMETICVLNCK